MKALRYTVITILSFLLVSILFLQVFLQNTYSTVRNPENLKSTLASSGFYSSLSDEISTMITANSIGQSEQLASIIQSTIKEIVTPAWVQIRFESLQDSFWANVEGTSTTLVAIDISDLRDTLIENLRNELDGTIPNQYVNEAIAAFEETIPIELEVTDFISGIDSTAIANLRTLDQQIKQITDQLSIISLLLSIVIFLLSFSLTTMLRWFGILFIILSGILFSFASFIPSIQDLLVQSNAIPQNFAAVVEKITLSYLETYASLFMSTLLIFIIVGIFLFSISFIPSIKKASVVLHTLPNSIRSILYVRIFLTLLVIGAVFYSSSIITDSIERILNMLS
jgi:hypothetical protein